MWKTKPTSDYAIRWFWLFSGNCIGRLLYYSIMCSLRATRWLVSENRDEMHLLSTCGLHSTCMCNYVINATIRETRSFEIKWNSISILQWISLIDNVSIGTQLFDSYRWLSLHEIKYHLCILHSVANTHGDNDWIIFSYIEPMACTKLRKHLRI